METHMYAHFCKAWFTELNWIESNQIELIWYDMIWYDTIGKGRHLYMHVLAM